MVEQKRYIPTSEKQEETHVDNTASTHDREIEVSTTTTAPTHQENAIELVARDESTVTTTTANFHLMIQEEEDLTIKVRRAADAFYDLVVAAIEKAKIRSKEMAREFISKDINPIAIAARKDAQDSCTWRLSRRSSKDI